MAKFSTSLTIDASQEVIWNVLSDVTRWYEWTPTVQKVEVLDTPELKLNNRYKVYQPKLQPAVWAVTVLTPRPTLPGRRVYPEWSWLRSMPSSQSTLTKPN